MKFTKYLMLIGVLVSGFAQASTDSIEQTRGALYLKMGKIRYELQSTKVDLITLCINGLDEGAFDADAKSRVEALIDAADMFDIDKKGYAAKAIRNANTTENLRVTLLELFDNATDPLFIALNSESVNCKK